MSHIVGQDKPTIDDTVAHFGVKGMKWGHRKSRSSSEAANIRGARRSVRNQLENINEQRRSNRKLTKGSKERAAGEKKLARMKTSLLKDPDRATAVRLTRGEKWLVTTVGLTGAAATGAAAPLAVAGVTLASRAITSKAIEAKQRKDRAAARAGQKK